MLAVADSNLARMAELWGSTKGSAAKTGNPADFERRVVIMQAYLRGWPYRIMSNTQDGADVNRRVLYLELTRPNCQKQVPVTMVRADGGAWLVNSIDLALVGSPGATCEEEAKPGT